MKTSASQPQGAIRVAHLTSVHGPRDSRIFDKECATLAASGYVVHLVAPSSEAESDGQVCVHTVAQPSSRWQRVTGTLREVYRTARAIDADLYHLHDPELLPLGVLLRLRGKRVIYDAHEDLPRQVLIKPWIPGWLRPLVSLGARLVERPATLLLDGVVAATPTIARRFSSRKTETVQNFPEVEHLQGLPKSDYRSRPAEVVYVGALSEARGVRDMVQAVGRLPSSLGARLSLAGTFQPTELADDVARMAQWKHVTYHGFLSAQGVRELLAQARAGLVVLRPEPSYLESMPIKLFEYMAAGLPVIASDFPLWRQIIEGAECGLLVTPKDPGALADAIRRVLERPEESETMGRKGREAVLARYNWGSEAEKLVRFYSRIVGSAP